MIRQRKVIFITMHDYSNRVVYDENGAQYHVEKNDGTVYTKPEEFEEDFTADRYVYIE